MTANMFVVLNLITVSVVVSLDQSLIGAILDYKEIGPSSHQLKW